MITNESNRYEGKNEPRIFTLYYVVLVLALGAALDRDASTSATPPAGEAGTMFEIASMADEKWTHLADLSVKARPEGVWTLALEWVKGPALLKFAAGDKEWFYSENDQ